MGLTKDLSFQDFEADFKVFHELMPNRIRKVLLVLSLFDAFILEEGGSLTSKIVSEYRGLNLSHPPRLVRVPSGKEALKILKTTDFDLVITLPQVDDMDYFTLGREIKKINPHLPVILLTHSLKGICSDPRELAVNGIDKMFLWSVDPDFLMSLVKNVEDHLNAAADTRTAMVRVIILVEDSPYYRSRFLPFLYREIVQQTQAVLDESLNQEHRLLKMRARPKILVAENYEDAISLYNRYQPFVFAVLSDVRFPKKSKLTDNTGVSLLRKIRRQTPDLPLLLLSSEPGNKQHAARIPATFIDKNSQSLNDEIEAFFLAHLGFGDFIFRNPDGVVIGNAANLHAFENTIRILPAESLKYHAMGNHFSHWVMARSEIGLAALLDKNRLSAIVDLEELRHDIVSKIHLLRKCRQLGVVAPFDSKDFDPAIMDFVTIGKGSLGGKALGLAFMAAQFRNNLELFDKFPGIAIKIPQTCVITTDGFDAFVTHNSLNLQKLPDKDQDIADLFLQAQMPEWLEKELSDYLAHINTPLSIRSSSLLEDAQYKPYAGLFETFMIPNNHEYFKVRLTHLLASVKLVFASSCFAGPRAFSKAVQTTGRESMAVIIQHLVGSHHGEYYYPAISGVAQSHNYYPFGNVQPEEGTAMIALGFGKTVVEGEKSLRFTPKYQKILPQFSTVEDMLNYSQRYFYALRIKDYPESLKFSKNSNLEKRELADAEQEFPVQRLCSTYFPEENRIRDSFNPGPKVLTFANVLKHGIFPLPEILIELLAIGRKGMGCPVEIEFSADLSEKDHSGDFFFLQIRPMVAGNERLKVEITEEEIQKAFCYSQESMGFAHDRKISEIVYVKPDSFDPAQTRRIADEIKKINALLSKDNQPYLLIGPGRWGSADPWLGIPVQWQDISGVGAMIELRNEQLKADPSQGSHFFHNITSLGIPYITVTEGKDILDWQWLSSIPVIEETRYLRHVCLKKPFTLKVDGAGTRQCVMITDRE
ncbi:MAG: phosphoenolpyruvate synthase/pyruvate phosphate dikinase [Proteobacteria bacterium]|nr:phosphoenolpyruvate synthase/pyruvate phosphate dikinase [Pseudomonadota bacterium]MBU1710174.1 phosphoenolpyruvate synthase/pyruvate phosphate dikinase [Pseudomonadota bacterium]